MKTTPLAPPQPLTQKEIALFFLPMLLNVQMMSISHSVINAFLASEAEAITALAGFSVAMVIHLLLASPSYQNHTITIAMVRGRKSYRGTVIFVIVVAFWVSLLLALLAFTRVGDFVLNVGLGTTGAVTAQAKAALGLCVFLPFITGFRGFFQGLLMQQRRTALVSATTGVRVGALFVLLVVGRNWFSGVALGAFGLVGCVATETLLVGFFALRQPPEYLPSSRPERGTAEILRFGFPLAYASCLQQTIPILISALLGRLADATVALAAYGILRGFLFLLAGPMRNLQQTYQTLARHPEDYQAILRFCRWTGSILAIAILLIAFPLRGVVLGTLMGLDPAMCSYIALPLAACSLYPLLYGFSNVLRGYFTELHRTAELGRSTIYKVGFVLMVWGLLLLIPLPVPGIVLAVFLLLASETCEAVYLTVRRRYLLAR